MAGVPFWGQANPIDVTGDDPSLIFSTIDNPSPWALLWIMAPPLEYQPLPGTVIIHEGGLKGLTDRKKPKGSRGHRITHLGDDNPPIDMTLTMWRPAQWDRWQQILPIIHPPRGEPPPAIGVTHPSLAAYQIDSLYLLHVSLVKLVPPDFGKGEVRLKWIQFLPPEPKTFTKSPASATNTSSIQTPGDLVPPQTRATAAPSTVGGTAPATEAPFQRKLG